MNIDVRLQIISTVVVDDFSRSFIRVYIRTNCIIFIRTWITVRTTSINKNRKMRTKEKYPPFSPSK